MFERRDCLLTWLATALKIFEYKQGYCFLTFAGSAPRHVPLPARLMHQRPLHFPELSPLHIRSLDREPHQ